MQNKRTYILFLTNFVIFFIGMGLFPILPLYAGEYGASQTAVGLYLAITYSAITAGSLLAGVLSTRMRLRPLFLLAGTAGVPALVLLGQATALWQVVVLTAIVWFSGGVGLALVSILTGLYAAGGKRGKSFGMMFLARPLAGVVGGIAAGQLQAWFGYGLMFSVMAFVWATWPLVVVLNLRAVPELPTTSPAQANAASAPPGGAFYGLLLVTLLSTTAVYMARLGTSLNMYALEFTPSAVASTAVIGSLVTIPLTPLIGTLSDRFDRTRLLMTGYLLAAAGAAILGAATQLWHFWLETTLLYITTSTNGAVAAALVTDMLDGRRLRRGLSMLNAVNWLAGIIGLASSGIISDALGAIATVVIATALSLTSAGGLLLLARSHTRVAREPASQPACV